jgi:hypothetical protein
MVQNMFNYEVTAASKQLSERRITFKVCNGYVTPDLRQDRHTLILAGFKKTAGNEQWFNELIDSEEFKKHFDEHTLIDWDDLAPEDTPAPSPLMERAWASFTV